MLFLALLIIGSVFRIVVMNNRDLFVDEVYYWRVAQMNSWKNLLFITHWIKDHGILYYVWLKALSFFATDIPTLRYSNILIYVLSSISFYGFFRDKYRFGALFGIVVFSFHRYFVYLSSTLSPYNLVWCLAVISICGLLFLVESKKTFNWKISFVVVFATVGAFYTDYSFFFTLPFYVFFFLFMISDLPLDSHKKRQIATLYGIIFILILPGLIQFIGNMDLVRDLFANRYFERSFLSFIYIMGGMLFLRVVPLLGIALMVLPLALVMKERRGTFLVASYLGSIGLIFVCQRFFFPLFAERYMWFPYFLYVLIHVSFLKDKNIGGALFALFFTLACIINYLMPVTTAFRVPGDIGYEVKYSSLLLNKKNTDAKQVVVLDRTSASDVLTRYYFGLRYPNTDRYSGSIRELKGKIVILSRRTDNILEEQKKLLAGKQRPCILYYITDKKEDILKNKIVKQMGCEKVYGIDNIYGYIDSFKLIYSTQP